MEDMEFVEPIWDEAQTDAPVPDGTPTEEAGTDTGLTDGEPGGQEGPGIPGEGTEIPENGTEGEGTETEDSAGHSVIEVNGSVLVLPEEYGYMPQDPAPETLGFLSQALDAQAQAVEEQTELLRCGFLCISLLLGMLIGVLLVQGFRLRRV